MRFTVITSALMLLIPAYLFITADPMSWPVAIGCVAMIINQLLVIGLLNYVRELADTAYLQKIQVDAETHLLKRFMDDLPRIMTARIDSGTGIVYEPDGKNDFQDIYEQYRQKHQEAPAELKRTNSCPAAIELMRYVKTPAAYKEIGEHVKSCPRCNQIVVNAFNSVDNDTLDSIT